MLMNYKDTPLSELLSNRSIFEIFDEEFAKGTWLDVTALLKSECTLDGLYDDPSIPNDILDSILVKLEKLHN